MKPRSIIRYHGGKHKLAEWLYKNFLSKNFVRKADYAKLQLELSERSIQVETAAALLSTLLKDDEDALQEKYWVIMKALGYIRIIKPERFKRITTNDQKI